MSKQKFNIGFVSLDDIQVLNGFIRNDTELHSIAWSGYEIKFMYQLNPAVNIASGKIRVVADYDIKAYQKEKEPAVSPANSQAIVSSLFRIAFLFTVEKLSEFAAVVDDNLVTMDEDMLSGILNISYSTSRGILYTRWSGTVLDGLILPVIPAADLMEVPSAEIRIPAKK